MAARECSWCDDPLRWWERWLGFWACKVCAHRLSMGGFPRRREDREVTPDV